MSENLKDFLWLPGIIAFAGILSLPPEWLQFIGICLTFGLFTFLLVGAGSRRRNGSEWGDGF